MADRYGLPIGDYWQTVHKICSGTSVLPQSFEQCSNSCSIIQSNTGLPTRRFWHNVYKFCERSANNLLLADHNGLPITPILVKRCYQGQHWYLVINCTTRCAQHALPQKRQGETSITHTQCDNFCDPKNLKRLCTAASVKEIRV